MSLRNEDSEVFLATEERYLGVILQSNLDSDIIIAAIGTTISKGERDAFFFHPRDLTAQIIHDLAKFED